MEINVINKKIVKQNITKSSDSIILEDNLKNKVTYKADDILIGKKILEMLIHDQKYRISF